jgi:hypothetical protein
VLRGNSEGVRLTASSIHSGADTQDQAKPSTNMRVYPPASPDSVSTIDRAPRQDRVVSGGAGFGLGIISVGR